MPSYMRMKLPESEKRRDRLQEIGMGLQGQFPYSSTYPSAPLPSQPPSLIPQSPAVREERKEVEEEKMASAEREAEEERQARVRTQVMADREKWLKRVTQTILRSSKAEVERPAMAVSSEAEVETPAMVESSEAEAEILADVKTLDVPGSNKAEVETLAMAASSEVEVETLAMEGSSEGEVETLAMEGSSEGEVETLAMGERREAEEERRARVRTQVMADLEKWLKRGTQTILGSSKEEGERLAMAASSEAEVETLAMAESSEAEAEILADVKTLDVPESKKAEVETLAMAASSEVEVETQFMAKRSEAEVETLAMGERREAEEETLARAKRRETEEERARAERMEERAKEETSYQATWGNNWTKDDSTDESESTAKVTSSGKTEIEAEEERRARAKRREAEVETLAMAGRREEQVKRRAMTAKREVEEERRARAEREAKREAEEERRARAEREAKRGAEEERARAKRMEGIVKGETLYLAICGNNWTEAKAFLDKNRSMLTAKVTSSGKTALHVAALFGRVSIVEELVRLVSPEFLETTDDFGNTPLLIATVTGITSVAKFLVNKNIKILGIPNSTNELPITFAFINGHQEMGRYLYSKTPLEYLRPENAPRQGAMLLHCLLQTRCFDIAFDLLNRCQELIFASDKEGWKPIYDIATMNSAIPSRNELVLWKRFIFDYINSNQSLDHDRLPIQQEERSERAPGNLTAELVAAGHCLLQQVISSASNLKGIKKIKELKLLHAQADKILEHVCKYAGRSDQLIVIADALFLAAKEGNVKFVLRLSKANPYLLLAGDSFDKNIFCYAVENRQPTVFNLIHGLRFKDFVVTSKDKFGNTLLHVAAAQAPAPVLNCIYGPTLQMQRECQWFTEVKSLIPPTIRGVRNDNGMTAEELFNEKHQDLMKQGEEWVRATASSCSLVGTLIVTIMFTAVFTVPGGNDQIFGFPLLIKQPFFKVFIFSTILSLVSASTSVLTFLAVLTSHYSKEKFLKSLPVELILGLSSLFISIVSMMVAFLSTIYLMLNHSNYSWGLLPFIMLASVPIVLFVRSQFPLLRHSVLATCGSIFNKNVEEWP